MFAACLQRLELPVGLLAESDASKEGVADVPEDVCHLPPLSPVRSVVNTRSVQTCDCAHSGIDGRWNSSRHGVSGHIGMRTQATLVSEVKMRRVIVVLGIAVTRADQQV